MCDEVASSGQTAAQMGGLFERGVDSIYFGGGTPTLLDVTQLERIFVTIRQNFDVQPNAEITVECAPGTLSEAMLETFVRCGVNRVSLGVQSFVDGEAASVGRLHKRSTVFDEIAQLRRAGVSNVNVDLIAGLPHQTENSWQESLDELIGTGVPHASVYMLEVDEDSRLGRELLAGGQKYHAHFVPDEDLIADLYELACVRLNAEGIQQYEISNFAREGFESKHNLKYWMRQPYLGFGVDAHSMLHANSAEDAVRFSNPDSLEKYVAGMAKECTMVSRDAALQESFFLGLRMNAGVDLNQISGSLNGIRAFESCISDLVETGLLDRDGAKLCLTPRGRLLSNEVFQRFVSTPVAL